jgi:hypothetical protein
MRPLTVLLTNFELTVRGGSQLYLRDVALGLLGRGHTPVVYSPALGSVALELSAATVPVVNDLAQMTIVPDVIHGQHNHELFTALLRFPDVPAVRVCHGWLDEAPQPFPRVLRYVAVDDTTRDRCVCEWGVPADRLDVVLNFVTLDRFTAVRSLPARPARALVFSNNASQHRHAVADACTALGISVDAIGHDVDNVTATPERALSQYDLVFAKGRAALEAIASGAAVILCDRDGLGPMVTTENVERLRRLNFGLRTLREPLSRDAVAREIARFDPVDAARVTQAIRATAGADAAIEALIQVYRDVIADWEIEPRRPAEEMRAASAYLQSLVPRLRWADDPRALKYLVLRALRRRLARMPGFSSIAQSPRARQLVLATRARWRARASGQP